MMEIDLININALDEVTLKKIEESALAGNIEPYRQRIQTILKHLSSYQIEKYSKLVSWAYPVGTLIYLNKMVSDDYPVPDQTFGTVSHVDAIGTLHMNWETGSSLGLIINLDLFDVVE